jgi:hypothetical protein
MAWHMVSLVGEDTNQGQNFCPVKSKLCFGLLLFSKLYLRGFGLKAIYENRKLLLLLQN